MKTIMCFGDSNTWGAVPGEQRRFSVTERWPSLLKQYLPQDWHIIEEAQPGRTTVHIDPFEDDKCGRAVLKPLLESHLPDLVVIMLGTNDLKHRFGLSANDISFGAAQLVKDVQGYCHWAKPKPADVLLIAPALVYENGPFAEMFIGAAEKSTQFAAQYAARAQELNCAFLDAGQTVKPCSIEGLHWHADQHAKFAPVVASKIQQHFSQASSA